MKLADGYGLWSDEQLFAHREACLREAQVQERWGDHQTQMYAKRCRDRAKVYDRELRMRGFDAGA